MSLPVPSATKVSAEEEESSKVGAMRRDGERSQEFRERNDLSQNGYGTRKHILNNVYPYSNSLNKHFGDATIMFVHDLSNNPCFQMFIVFDI